MQAVLKYLRKINDFTQEQVAQRIGFSRQSYIKYESGALVPPDEAVARLALLYGVEESFIRENKVPALQGSVADSASYKIDENFGLLKIASPTEELSGYDAYFDGNTVRVIDNVKFRYGQRLKVYPLSDDESERLEKQKREEAWKKIQGILSKHSPLAIPPDEDPFYKESYHKALEEKYGRAD